MRIVGSFLLLVLDFKIYLFLERGEGREKEGEKHWCVREILISCLLIASPTWDQACNPGLGPDQESKWHLSTTPNQLSHTGQRENHILSKTYYFYASQ